MSEQLPAFIVEAPVYDAADAYHVRKWELAGKPPLDQLDGDGQAWRPTIISDLQDDGSYLRRALPEPTSPLTDVEILFNQVQAKLDADEYKRTGKRVDPAGAVSKARAWAATAMLYSGWHYPSEADLAAGANPAILAAIYADPASNTTAESTVAQKRKVLGFTLVMLEGQAFGVEYVAELGAYERTASGAFLVALANDQRDWLELPCGPWESVRAMFLAVLK